jgi:phage terminase small subunit
MALTDKQEAFAVHYARYNNGAAAYMHAYNAKNALPASISVEASKLKSHPKIAQRVAELREATTATSDVTLELKQIFAKLCLQVVTDPRELMTVRTGNCRHCNGEDFAYRWRDGKEYQGALRDWQRLAEKGVVEDMPGCEGGFGWRPFHASNPECPECGGGGTAHASHKATDEYSPGAAALYEGFKQTAHGIEIKTADRQKSMEMLIRMLGGFDDKLELKGQLAATIKAAVAVASDQHAAASMYADMLKGR